LVVVVAVVREPFHRWIAAKSMEGGKMGGTTPPVQALGKPAEEKSPRRPFKEGKREKKGGEVISLTGIYIHLFPTTPTTTATTTTTTTRTRITAMKATPPPFVTTHWSSTLPLPQQPQQSHQSQPIQASPPMVATLPSPHSQGESHGRRN